MPKPNVSTNKRKTLNIRIKPEERNLIDLAARMRGKNRTDFILDAVRLAAEEALFEQAIIMASPDTYATFLARLEEQPPSQRALACNDATPRALRKGMPHNQEF